MSEQSNSGLERDASYLNLGRRNQKLRTRDALVAAAVDLIHAGKAVSVAEVADSAKVSRTTAYRYFPTSEILAAQATLAAYDHPEARAIEEMVAGSLPPEKKIDAIILGAHEMVAHHEAAFRSLVRFTVETPLDEGRTQTSRPSFRQRWMEMALAPYQKELGQKRFEQLVGALCLLCGVESLIVLKDICGMPQKQQREVKLWAAQQLLKAALQEARHPVAKKA